MKMKKEFLLLFLVLIFAACNDQVDKTDLQPLASTAIELTYPSGIGTSGDTINGLLGYGYDASGLCDTISVKAKVFATLPIYGLYLDHPNSTFPTLVSGSTFNELLTKIRNPYIIRGSGEILTQHLKSLMKLANVSDSINSNYAYTYYACTYINLHRSFYPDADNQRYLSSDFKNDIVTLTANEIVSKYGTHVITNLFNGTKFEVLYRCKFSSPTNGTVCEDLFYNRMKEFMGGIFGIYKEIDTNTKHFQSGEQLIYNSIGSRKKISGIINVTDYNPDSIRLNIGSIFDKENIKTQFVTIGSDGILPIYELINDETKKQEVKLYIEKYMPTKTID